MNRLGKVLAIVSPICTLSLLQISSLKKTFTGYMVLADLLRMFFSTQHGELCKLTYLLECLVMSSLAIGSVAILAILVKYVDTRRKLQSFNMRYGQGSRHASGQTTTRNDSIYDHWLLGRFTLAFIIIK